MDGSCAAGWRMKAGRDSAARVFGWFAGIMNDTATRSVHLPGSGRGLAYQCQDGGFRRAGTDAVGPQACMLPHGVKARAGGLGRPGTGDRAVIWFPLESAAGSVSGICAPMMMGRASRRACRRPSVGKFLLNRASGPMPRSGWQPWFRQFLLWYIGIVIAAGGSACQCRCPSMVSLVPGRCAETICLPGVGTAEPASARWG